MNYIWNVPFLSKINLNIQTVITTLFKTENNQRYSLNRREKLVVKNKISCSIQNWNKDRNIMELDATGKANF